MIDIGVDLGGTRTKIGLVRSGDLLTTRTVASHAEESMATRLPGISSAVDDMLAQHPGYREELRGIGLAFPSVVDASNKHIISRYVKFTDAPDHDLEAWAKHHWGIPLALENDARAALIGEWQYGAGKGFSNIVLITLGTGVGSAVLINDQLFRGSHHVGGNLGGHTIIDVKGQKCNCGAFGCVETLASGWALDARCRSHSNFARSALSKYDLITFKHVFSLAGEDKLALQIRDESLQTWAAHVYNMVHHFDPQIVIIGGGVMHAGDIILDYIQDYVDRYCWLEPGSVHITAAVQSDYAGILGMAYLASQA